MANSRNGYELRLAGYSSSADENDNLVIWVSSSVEPAKFKAKLASQKLYDDQGKSAVESIAPLDLKFAQDDIELIITEDEHFDALGKLIDKKLSKVKRCA